MNGMKPFIIRYAFPPFKTFAEDAASAQVRRGQDGRNEERWPVRDDHTRGWCSCVHLQKAKRGIAGTCCCDHGRAAQSHSAPTSVWTWRTTAASNIRADAWQGGVEMMSASQKKTMGAGLGVKMKGRLGKRLGSNDLRLRLGGGGASAPPSKVKVTFEQHSAGSAAQASEDTERWGNDMYFKSGQAQMAAPLRQAVMERPPSFLTTATGRRREASAAVSAGSARVLASTGILKVHACIQAGSSMNGVFLCGMDY